MLQLLNGFQHKTGSMALLEALLAGSVGTGAQIRLFKPTLAPSPDTPAADFEANECDFPGYDTADIEWSPPGISPSNVAFTMSQNAVFKKTGTEEGNMVGGAWIRIPSGGTPPTNLVMSYCVFNPPIAMTAENTSFGMKAILEAPDTRTRFIVES